MWLVERVRLLGGFPGLSDEELGALVALAEAQVTTDLERLGTQPDSTMRETLVVLRACALAARRARPPVSESAGGISANYKPLDWEAEYAAELNRVRLACGATVRGGMP
ncbi:MAG: hypothetical protein QXU79_00120 [Candidatus Micrarchaeaceae archaeon]